MGGQQSDASGPRLVLPPDFEGVVGAEAELRGWYGSAHVLAPDGKRYPVSFMEPTRLLEDAEREFARGSSVVHEYGVLFVPVVRREQMERAVQQAWAEGHFNGLRPLDEG